jgi:hypothetical protein
MPSPKGVRKPRISEFGQPHAVRFKKKIERELAMLCLRKDIRPSSVIQAAVECFIGHPDCQARTQLIGSL